MYTRIDIVYLYVKEPRTMINQGQLHVHVGVITLLFQQPLITSFLRLTSYIDLIRLVSLLDIN